MVSGLRGASNPSSGTGRERRTWFGHLARLTFGPILQCLWWWFDLFGPDGRPEHGKVLSSIAFLWGVVVLSTQASFVAELCVSSKPGCGASMTFFLAFAALVFAMAFGVEGFRIWAKFKAGGTTEALGQAAAAAESASAAIAARRQRGGEYEVTD